MPPVLKKKNIQEEKHKKKTKNAYMQFCKEARRSKEWKEWMEEGKRTVPDQGRKLGEMYRREGKGMMGMALKGKVQMRGMGL